MSKYSEGPWETSVLSNGTQWNVCREGGGDAIALMVPQRNVAEEESNANLIAAAPDLLEALEEVTRALVEHINIMAKDSNLPPNKVCPCTDNEVSKARKAIAKAKGE